MNNPPFAGHSTRPVVPCEPHDRGYPPRPKGDPAIKERFIPTGRPCIECPSKWGKRKIEKGKSEYIGRNRSDLKTWPSSESL